MKKYPPQETADPTTAGVHPAYRPEIPSYLTIPPKIRKKRNLALGLVLSVTWRRIFTTSSGSKSVVDAVPAAIPAIKGMVVLENTLGLLSDDSDMTITGCS